MNSWLTKVGQQERQNDEIKPGTGSFAQADPWLEPFKMDTSSNFLTREVCAATEFPPTSSSSGGFGGLSVIRGTLDVAHALSFPPTADLVDRHWLHNCGGTDA